MASIVCKLVKPFRTGCTFLGQFLYETHGRNPEYHKKTKMIILDGNLEIGAHGLSDLDYLICLRHLFILRAVIYFPISFTHAHHVVSNHLIQGPWEQTTQCTIK